MWRVWKSRESSINCWSTVSGPPDHLQVPRLEPDGWYWMLVSRRFVLSSSTFHHQDLRGATGSGRAFQPRITSMVNPCSRRATAAEDHIGSRKLRRQWLIRLGQWRIGNIGPWTKRDVRQFWRLKTVRTTRGTYGDWMCTGSSLNVSPSSKNCKLFIKYDVYDMFVLMIRCQRCSLPLTDVLSLSPF